MDRYETKSARRICALALSALALTAAPACAKIAVARTSPASVQPAPAPAPVQFGFDPAARAAWLDDCHRRIGYRDADRTYDSGECEAYLASYAARYEAAARGEPGYVYGYAPGMVPVMMVPVSPSGTSPSSTSSSGVSSMPAPSQQPVAAPPTDHANPVIDYAYLDTGSRLSFRR